jgi:hypothetical protein
VYGAVVCSYDAVSLFYLELYVKLSIYLSMLTSVVDPGETQPGARNMRNDYNPSNYLGATIYFGLSLFPFCACFSQSVCVCVGYVIPHCITLQPRRNVSEEEQPSCFCVDMIAAESYPSQMCFSFHTVDER